MAMLVSNFLQVGKQAAPERAAAGLRVHVKTAHGFNPAPRGITQVRFAISRSLIARYISGK
jgi:hypothetical protein